MSYVTVLGNIVTILDAIGPVEVDIPGQAAYEVRLMAIYSHLPSKLDIVPSLVLSPPSRSPSDDYGLGQGLNEDISQTIRLYVSGQSLNGSYEAIALSEAITIAVCENLLLGSAGQVDYSMAPSWSEATGFALEDEQPVIEYVGRLLLQTREAVDFSA